MGLQQQVCLLILSCALLSVSTSAYSGSDFILPSVAFVFAGSPRSFMEPMVRESIRMNLIHSFCPPDSCRAAIFARVSLDDNVHQQKGGAPIRHGRGNKVIGDEQEKPVVAEALRRITKVPLGHKVSGDSVPLVMSWSQVGSPLERKEMEQEYNSINHKVFRAINSRHYSLYFNRQKSYEQVTAYEKEHNMTFTWVVQARLDSLFGEPLQPVHFWETLDHTVNHRYDKFPKTSDHLRRTGLHGQLWDESKDLMPKADVSSLRVWVPDSWCCNVPDTFALIPRHFADGFFSMDNLVRTGVMCIGGHHFSPGVVSPESLDALGFTDEEKAFAWDKKNKCGRLGDGNSESFLKKKLRFAGISFDKGTLGYQSFFLATVRMHLANMCNYLAPRMLMGWVHDAQFANSASYAACLHFVELTRVLRQGGMKPIKSNRRTALGSSPPRRLLTNKGNTSFSSHCSHDGDGEFTGMNCLLDKTQTDWNFMPFRLHKHHQCLTSEKPEGGQLLQHSCATHARVELSSKQLANSTYSGQQLFHFLPLLPTTQQIRIFKGVDKMCLTVGSTTGQDEHLRKSVSLEPCFSSYSTDRGLSQQFLVRVLHSTAAEHLTANEHRQFIVSPKNNPHSILPAVSVVSVAHVGHRKDLKLLAKWPSRREATTQGSLRCLAMYPGRGQGQSVAMEPCDENSPNQKIVIERSSSVAWVKYIRKRIEHEHYFAES